MTYVVIVLVIIIVVLAYALYSNSQKDKLQAREQ